MIFDRYWLMPTGQLHAVVVLDLSIRKHHAKYFGWPRPAISILIGLLEMRVPTDSCLAPSLAAKRVSIFCGSMRALVDFGSIRLLRAKKKRAISV